MNKEFNWNGFINNRIVVNCQSEEECMDFLQECEERDLKWSNGNIATNFQEYKNYGRETCFACENDEGIGFGDREYFYEEEPNMRMVKWSNYMVEIKTEKTFREVIADIKEGETWIQKDNGYIVSKIANFGGDIVIELDSSRSVFGTKGTYTLERKEYSFIEAFSISLNEGKEIESCESCLLVKKYNDGIKYRYSNISDIWQCADSFEPIFSIKEIQGKWYINN